VGKIATQKENIMRTAMLKNRAVKGGEKVVLPHI
jgi:hypothetical protein